MRAPVVFAASSSLLKLTATRREILGKPARNFSGCTSPLVSLSRPAGRLDRAKKECGAEVFLSPLCRYDSERPFRACAFLSIHQEDTGLHFAFSQEQGGVYARGV